MKAKWTRTCEVAGGDHRRQTICTYLYGVLQRAVEVARIEADLKKQGAIINRSRVRSTHFIIGAPLRPLLLSDYFHFTGPEPDVYVSTRLFRDYLLKARFWAPQL